jgi:glycosyltransferase involved in cell wall biosynthesis
MLRIVIPAKDEAARIERTIDDCCSYFGDRARVLVVLNGCTDDTSAIVHALCARYPTLEIIEIPAPIGKGGAVRAGLTLGAEPFVAFADADGSASARQIDLLLQHCALGGAAGAIGSRWIGGATIGRRQPFRRRVASRAFNLAVRLLFGLRFSDTQCGAKVFRRAAMEAVFDDLELANFAFDVDVLFAMRRARMRVAEVPIVWADEPNASKVRLVRSGISMLSALLRLRLKHSPFGRWPFADKLARGSAMPVKSGLSALVLVDSDEPFVVPPSLRAVLDEMADNGQDVAVRDVRDPVAALRFYAWYAREGQRRFDVVLDATHGRAEPLLRVSSKPKIGRAALERMTESAVRDALDSMARACGYAAFLWRTDRDWVVAAYGRTQIRTVIRAALQR